jgi:hypothetical protein
MVYSPVINPDVRDFEQPLLLSVELFFSLTQKITGRKIPVDMVVPAIG